MLTPGMNSGSSISEGPGAARLSSRIAIAAAKAEDGGSDRNDDQPTSKEVTIARGSIGLRHISTIPA